MNDGREKASRTTTDLEVLGLPLGAIWELTPGPSWSAENDVSGEGEDGDRLGREHGHDVGVQRVGV